MVDATTQILRVALIADQSVQADCLKSVLEAGGLKVVMTQSIREHDPDAVSADMIDVLLVNLDDDTSYEMERLDLLIERSAVPILFNEGGVSDSKGWNKKLFAKLAGLAQSQVELKAEKSRHHTAAVVVVAQAEAMSAARGGARPVLRVIDKGHEAAESAREVWVLGSSLGGPQALKLFLSTLPDGLSIGFVIAQHIGKPFVPLLAEQLGRVTGMRVTPAVAGTTVQAGEVILVPIDVRFTLTDAGVIELRDEPTRGPYKPCIDEVMEEVARCYGNRAAAIVFSGMGEDGAVGALAINAAGGRVWAQDAPSCSISSMPDAARRRGVVEFSGTPDELAQRLAEQCAAHAGAG